MQDLIAYNTIMNNIIPIALIANDGPININRRMGGAITAADIVTLNNAFQLMLAKARAAAAGAAAPRDPVRSFQDMSNLAAYVQTRVMLQNLFAPRPGNIPRLQAMYASCSAADRQRVDALAQTAPAGFPGRAAILACFQLPAPGPGMVRTANLTQMCYQFNCLRIGIEAGLTLAQARAAMQLVATTPRHVAVTDNYFRLVAARNPDIAAILGNLNGGNLTLYDQPHLVLFSLKELVI